MYSRESLQSLKEKIDLIDLISSYIDLKRAGAGYQALCPFHDEKTPSFTLKRGDTHYHCFGCGAHGDAIQFLMQLQGMSFREAVESLAERYHVPLQRERGEERGIQTRALYEVLAFASAYYHRVLLHTEEGKGALAYLEKRGLNRAFIERFQIGYAPEDERGFLEAVRKKGFADELLAASGLFVQGKKRAFFRERITFPVHNAAGQIVAFSARKIREETFGGKYINSPETSLFKKSRLLFGLNHSRRRIVKEQRVLLVEGQIDCLRLIDAGFDYTVAALGTAFGEGHVEVLKQLNVHQVSILFDADLAGLKAASKVGNLFQKVGVEVKVVLLPAKSDPDAFLKEKGKDKLQELIALGRDYLTFQVQFLGRTYDLKSPASKATLVKEIAGQIRTWEDPIMVHESLQKLAELTQLPADMVGTRFDRPTYVRAQGGLPAVDPDLMLEVEFLRLLLQGESSFRESACRYLEATDFLMKGCRKLYTRFIELDAPDLLTLMGDVDDAEMEACVDAVMQKKIPQEKAKEAFVHLLQKIVDRTWLAKRAAINEQIQSHQHSDEEALTLLREFDATPRPRVEV